MMKVVEDRSEFRAELQPGHPHAVATGSDAGTVYFPNVNPWSRWWT
jgi:flagellar basal body rod protein FlgC